MYRPARYVDMCQYKSVFTENNPDYKNGANFKELFFNKMYHNCIRINLGYSYYHLSILAICQSIGICIYNSQ